MRLAILSAALVAIFLVSASAANAVNFVEMILIRVDSALSPGVGFEGEVSVNLEDETGVTGVSVMAGTMPLVLDQDFDVGDSWYAEGQFATLADVKTALHGTWTINIDGSSPSVSTFDFDANGLDENTDFFPSPTGLVPAHGSSDVSLDTTLSWVDPTGSDTPFVLVVIVGRDEFGEQEDFSSPFGGLAVTDVAWTPPLILFPGPTNFNVSYFDGDSSFVTGLSVTSGSIAWGNSPFAPTAPPFGPWPTATPLLALGGSAEVQFTTAPLVEDFETYALQADTSGPTDFLVTTTGNLADPVVTSVSEALASSAGIADDAGNKVWSLGSTTGPTGIIDGTEGFFLIGDLPGFGGVTTAGPFSDFFAGPREIFGATIRADVRKSTGTEDTQFRFLVVDASDNEAATGMKPLGTSFSQYSASGFDFVDFASNAGPTDYSQIVGFGFEFFVDPASAKTVSAVQFQIDNVELVPEPSSTLLGLSAIATLALIARTPHPLHKTPPQAISRTPHAVI